MMHFISCFGRRAILVLASSVLLIAATSCEVDGVGPRTTPKPTASLEPTPTLVPGLPTSTASADRPETADAGGSIAETTATPLPTATAQPTPSATPLPGESLELGQSYLVKEDFAAAAERFDAGLNSDQLDGEEQQQALAGLGKALLFNEQPQQAVEALSQFLARAALEASDGETIAPAASQTDFGASEAYFMLARSYEALADCEAAINAYHSYLVVNPDMVAYIQPSIADCWLTLGDRSKARTALEEAASGEAHPSVMRPLRERLAQMYLEDGDLASAAGLYESILESERDAATLARAHYLLGSTLLMAGDAETGYRHFQSAVNEYPNAYDSYLALTELIQAGFAVDDFQRGLVDFHAGAYEPAVAAFSRHIETNPAYELEAHLYLAWSYEGLGNTNAALEQIDAYVLANMPGEDVASVEESPADRPGDVLAAARGWIERAKLQTRAGLLDDAIGSYTTYVERFPEGEQAPFAAWWAAALSERQDDLQGAIERYLALAESFPEHEDTPEALFRTGYLNWQEESIDDANSVWRRAALDYPGTEFGAASLLWLVRTSDQELDEELQTVAAELDGHGYYTLRAQQVISKGVPFERPDDVSLEFDPEGASAAGEWLRLELGLEEEVRPEELSAELTADERLQRGEKLWRLGLREEAKRELESLRFDFQDDPLASYQLAIFFSELGLYRSSILAAESVIRQLGVSVFDAPRYLARLAYPTYYSDLVMAEAEIYDSDPLLQFALIRQESLFESFATSSAAAQGLSQVIPDTGAYIAQRLAWPDFENEDLYKPYVGIAFGAYYLNQQLDAFDDNVAVALSAYNGGPGNASRWYESAHDDLDAYLEIVDFAETRLYIKRIFVGHVIYSYLYGN